jgi:predicted phosphodiesterase
MPEPTITELGDVEGPLLVFGGVYSNLEAFKALLARARALGIPPQRMVHTGDVVAYCADARAASERLRDTGCHAIRGNVEQQLGEGAADCGCGFEAGSQCDTLSASWYAHAMRQMTPDLCAWFACMPDQLRFTMNGVRFHVLHGAAADVSRFMFASLPEQEFERELALSGADCVLAGHTGIPFTRRVADRLWHNSGSVGMPANDGTRRGWYSLVRPLGDGIVIDCAALAFDADAAAAKLRAATLPQAYARTLETGLWPNTHHLPQIETAATGKPLAAATMVWSPHRAAAE